MTVIAMEKTKAIAQVVVPVTVAVILMTKIKDMKPLNVEAIRNCLQEQKPTCSRKRLPWVLLLQTHGTRAAPGLLLPLPPWGPPGFRKPWAHLILCPPQR